MTREIYAYCWIAVWDERGAEMVSKLKAAVAQQDLRDKLPQMSKGDPYYIRILQSSMLAPLATLSKPDSVEWSMFSDIASKSNERFIAIYPTDGPKDVAEAWIKSTNGTLWSVGAVACQLLAIKVSVA